MMWKPWAFYTLYWLYAALCVIVPALSAYPRRKAWLLAAATLAVACAYGLNRAGSLIPLAFLSLAATGVGRAARSAGAAAATGAAVLALPFSGFFLFGLLYALDLETHENVCFTEQRLTPAYSCRACNQPFDSIQGWRIVLLRDSPSLFTEDVIGTVTDYAGAKPASIRCTADPDGTVRAKAIDSHGEPVDTYPRPPVRLPADR